jgi:hypothetical protein
MQEFFAETVTLPVVVRGPLQGGGCATVLGRQVGYAGGRQATAPVA